jgi:hypothetical protein
MIPAINEVVDLVNQIVIRSYQLIRLYVLYCFQEEKSIPEINKSFCYLALTTVSRPNKITKQNQDPLKQELTKFYLNHYLPLLPEGSFTLETNGLSETLQKISIEMETAYLNNLSIHFFPRLKKFVKNELNKVLKKGQTTEEKRYWSQIFTSLMNSLHDKDKKLSPLEFIKIYDDGLNYLPEHDFDEGSLSYDVQSNTLKYLVPTLKLNQYFEKERDEKMKRDEENDRKEQTGEEKKKKSLKLCQPLCLRNQMVPKYVPINIKSLIYLFDFPNLNCKKTSLFGRIQKVPELEQDIWNTHFNMDKKFMKQKGYSFYNRIDTDGFGCSITFIKSQYRRLAFKPKFKINQNPYQLVTSLDEEQLEKLKERTLVGLDPGKGVLAMLVDKKGKTVKYTSSQRRYESFQKNAKYVRDRLKTMNKLQETEKVLADHDARTMNVEKFKDFIRVKMVVTNKVKEHYDQIIYRKLRLRTFVEGKKSVDNFLKRIEDTYGSKPLIGYGNWSRSSQMKFQAPTMGRGLRRQIHQRFETLTVLEVQNIVINVKKS